MLFLRKTVLNVLYKIIPCENCENDIQVTFWASALSMGHAQKSQKHNRPQQHMALVWHGVCGVLPFCDADKNSRCKLSEQNLCKRTSFSLKPSMYI